MKRKCDLPIGVFDSGVGGLTVMREMIRQLPHEKIIYFGDTARVPYGSKSPNIVVHFSKQITRFLLGKQVKLIVIACNTASALALEALQGQFEIPIIGVVIPGARAAIEATQINKIGVVGTDATVRSGIYTKIIQGMQSNIQVLEKACPLFVPLVEEGFKEHPVTEEVIAHYLASMREAEIDAMILGCTHYPLLRSRIMKYLGEKIQIVNPAYETAMDIKGILAAQNLENNVAMVDTEQYVFYVSDAAEKFQEFANTVMPISVSETKVVNIERY
ncbi:MAG: glutamate racemase [Lachnospiraceae bacterium]|nr:glutamate racemase [Lachnospiraceae bacterium]